MDGEPQETPPTRSSPIAPTRGCDWHFPVRTGCTAGEGAWRTAAIKEAPDRADIVVLLVTANFIGSEYIHAVELLTESPLIDLQPDDTLQMLRRIAWRIADAGVHRWDAALLY